MMRLTIGAAWLAGLGFSAWSALALAQPEIFGTSAALVDGGSFSIQGRDFGQKNPAAPWVYQDFEDGTVGEEIIGQDEGGFWHQGPPREPIYSQGKQRLPSEICMLQDYADDNNKQFGLIADCDTIYMSGWCYRDDWASTAMLSDNQKLWGNFIACDDDGTPIVTPGARYDTYFAYNTGHMEINDANGSNLYNNWSVGCNPMLNQWFRMERYMAMGTVNGNNGVTWVAANLRKLGEITGTFFTSGDPYCSWYVGHYFRNTSGATLRVYWSEVYVDSTLARVEVGDNAVWANCTHREIQIPSAWRDDAITVTANQGTFPSGQALYVFVVNRYGQPSGGSAVTFATSSGEEGVPGQPGQPAVIR